MKSLVKFRQLARFITPCEMKLILVNSERPQMAQPVKRGARLQVGAGSTVHAPCTASPGPTRSRRPNLHRLEVGHASPSLPPLPHIPLEGQNTPPPEHPSFSVTPDPSSPSQDHRGSSSVCVTGADGASTAPAGGGHGNPLRSGSAISDAMDRYAQKGI